MQALAKFAILIMTIHDMLGDQALAMTALTKLKLAFSEFSQNKQQYPLVYECKQPTPRFPDRRWSI